SVQQMKQTSGIYTETKWIKSDETQEKVAHASCLRAGKSLGGAPASQEQAVPNEVNLDSAKWQEKVGKLAAQFNTSPEREATSLGVRRLGAAFQGGNESSQVSDVAQDYRTLPVGELSPLQEDDSAYYALAVLNKAKGRLKVATVVWLK